MITYLSRDKGLGSGRMASIAEQEVEDEEEDVGGGNGWRGTRSRSREPHFLFRGSMPAAPCRSLSIGHDPARLNTWKSAAVAPWMAAEEEEEVEDEEDAEVEEEVGSWVGDEEGGERDFFFSSFRRTPLFFSF